MLERLICFALRPTAWDSGWAARAQPDRMNVGASYIFLRWRPTGDARLGWANTRSTPQAGPHECLSVLYFFLRWRADCVNSGAAHAQRRPDRMNVERLIFFFCVGGSTAWDSGWAARRPRNQAA
jgi:hypothetical protein